MQKKSARKKHNLVPRVRDLPNTNFQQNSREIPSLRRSEDPPTLGSCGNEEAGEKAEDCLSKASSAGTPEAEIRAALNRDVKR